MVTFVGSPGERSPDRLDSLVWACTPFLDYDFDFSGKPRVTGARNWASSADLDAIGRDRTARARERLTRPDQQSQRRSDPWDEDSFAPQDDPRPTRRNVRSWG